MDKILLIFIISDSVLSASCQVLPSKLIQIKVILADEIGKDERKKISIGSEVWEVITIRTF
jgi:hypothetical protein